MDPGIPLMFLCTSGIALGLTKAISAERRIPESLSLFRGKILPFSCIAAVIISLAAQAVAMWVTGISYHFFPLHRDHFGFAGLGLALASLPLSVFSSGVLKRPAIVCSLNVTALWLLSVMYFL